MALEEIWQGGGAIAFENANITAGPKGNVRTIITPAQPRWYQPMEAPTASSGQWTEGVSGGSSFLVANDVAGFNNQLYVSPASGSDALTGRIMSFHTPMVANGRVYVGTISTLNAYGKR